MKHMVICGFSGVGKSTAEQKSRTVFDMESSGFSHNIVNGCFADKNPAFPANYIDHLEYLMEQHGKQSVFLLSCHKEVREELQSRGIPYIIVMPYPHLKNEYLKRWLMRGSDIEFIEAMSERWDEMIESCENDSAPKIYLDKGEYISDLLCI